uniref:Uncharacterized protein n=1 Tax=Trichuris muris TaxID=70415 RepID=A0A5S6R022_TRIMR
MHVAFMADYLRTEVVEAMNGVLRDRGSFEGLIHDLLWIAGLWSTTVPEERGKKTEDCYKNLCYKNAERRLNGSQARHRGRPQSRDQQKIMDEVLKAGRGRRSNEWCAP